MCFESCFGEEPGMLQLWWQRSDSLLEKGIRKRRVDRKMTEHEAVPKKEASRVNVASRSLIHLEKIEGGQISVLRSDNLIII